MPSLNECRFMGHLGKDPDMRYTPEGKAVVNFSIAVNHSYKKGDEWVKTTEWVNVVVWGDAAERTNARAKKGSFVYVSGRMATRSWEKDAQTHYKTEIIADKVMILDKTENKEEIF